MTKTVKFTDEQWNQFIGMNKRQQQFIGMVKGWILCTVIWISVVIIWRVV